MGAGIRSLMSQQGICSHHGSTESAAVRGQADGVKETPAKPAMDKAAVLRCILNMHLSGSQECDACVS